MYPRALLALTVVVLAACGTRMDDVPGQGGAGGGAAGGGGAGDKDAGPINATATTFVLENGGVAPMIVGNQCGGLWLSLQHGTDDVLVDRSCACSCEDGSVCGCPAICRVTEDLLMPGQSATQAWDGVVATMAAGQTCYVPTVPETGEPLTAQACWNVDDETGARSCVTDAFAYGVQEEVRLVAEPPVQEAVETTILLDNETGGAIELATERCGSQAWFDVARSGASLSVRTFCPCACDADYGLAACPSCGACAPDVTETLQQGEHKQLVWDGKFWFTYESTCQARYDMPPAVMLDAKVCWTKPGSAVPHCATAGFSHGQKDPVRVIAR